MSIHVPNAHRTRWHRVDNRGSLAREAITSISRHPLRTVVSAAATAIAVCAFVAVNGITSSAQDAVSRTFNALAATIVEFQGGTSVDPVLTEAGVGRLRRLHGVISAGLLWDINEQQPFAVSRTLTSSPGETAQLSATAASAAALRAIGAKVSSGRLYDDGADRFHQMVVLLGADAAQQLGIYSTIGQPAIFINHTALTVEGIIGSTSQESQVLLGIVVPPYVASVIGPRTDTRRVIARTRLGAAQVIGREGPYALAPYNTSQVTSEVPPDPATLKASVQRSLTSLLDALEVVGMAVGIISITTITLLAVSQRRIEIGLRRAVGYHRWDIARLILIETAGVGVVGASLGASFGVLTVSVFAAAHGWAPTLNPATVGVSPLLGIAIGVAAGAIPAVAAAKITPMSALRS
jgi:putative ABC transport system permease protein